MNKKRYCHEVNKGNLESGPMSESSRLPLGLGDSQGRIIGCGKHSYSQLWSSKRTQNKISKGKGTWAELKEIRYKLPRVFSQWNHRSDLISSATSYDNAGKALPITDIPRKFGVFNWGLVTWALIPSTYQNSRITEGKHVFSINYVVCTLYAQ